MKHRGTKNNRFVLLSLILKAPQKVEAVQLQCPRCPPPASSNINARYHCGIAQYLRHFLKTPQSLPKTVALKHPPAGLLFFDPVYVGA